MTENEIRAWLRLSRLELSSKSSYSLIEHYKTPEAIFNASKDELLTFDWLTEKAVSKLTGPIPAAVEKDLAVLESQKINIIPITSDNYPSTLKQIYDPPVILYVRGAFVESDRFAVGIVGSRRATNYGRSITEKIARDLVHNGLVIVSGGARGIDTSAHKSALASNGRTIAVLGCGVDVNYPAENEKLYEAISQNGAVISEFPLASAPEPWRFPPRNRLISGLSLGVLVCQSPEASGALITAGYAAEQGKDVWAIPGNVDDERNRGCHKLIKDGAKLVENVEDILEELGIDSSEKRTSQMSFQIPPANLSENEKNIIVMLSLEPMQIDEIITKSGLTTSVTASTLTLLEMKSIVRRLPGNAYVRVL